MSRPVAHVRVEIDELVLRGVRDADRHRMATAFQRELARLLRSKDGPVNLDRDAEQPVVSELPRLPSSASPRQVGQALARVVHTALTVPDQSGGGGPGVIGGVEGAP